MPNINPFSYFSDPHSFIIIEAAWREANYRIILYDVGLHPTTCAFTFNSFKCNSDSNARSLIWCTSHSSNEPWTARRHQPYHCIDGYSSLDNLLYGESIIILRSSTSIPLCVSFCGYLGDQDT